MCNISYNDLRRVFDEASNTTRSLVLLLSGSTQRVFNDGSFYNLHSNERNRLNTMQCESPSADVSAQNGSRTTNFSFL